MSNFALNGDRTTTGGIVIATKATMFNRSRRVALSGEHATCGNCKGSFPMYGTAVKACEQGTPAVLHGDQVMCPCGKNRVMAFDEGMGYSHLPGESAGNAVSAAATAAVTSDDESEEVIEQCFALLENGTTPVAGYHYDLFRDGELHTKAGGYSRGETVPVTGHANLKLVTWMFRDGSSRT
jgi:hypothetical protein